MHDAYETNEMKWNVPLWPIYRIQVSHTLDVLHYSEKHMYRL